MLEDVVESLLAGWVFLQPFLWVVIPLLLSVVMVVTGLWWAHRDVEEAEEVKPAPKATRKEDLDRFCRGEIGIQEYLDLHSGTPDDKSLGQPFLHRGRRVDTRRVRHIGGVWYIYQPQAAKWVEMPRPIIHWYTDDPGYAWIEEVNGKRIV